VIILVGDIAYEVVGVEETGDAITIPSIPTNETEEEIEELKPPAVESESGGGSNMLCPGFAFAITIVAIPFAKSRQRK
jgi:hypothetical protein